MITPTEGELAAARQRNATAAFVGRCEEVVFLTDIYGLDTEMARRELGCSDKAMRNYLAYIATHRADMDEALTQEGHVLAR